MRTFVLLTALCTAVAALPLRKGGKEWSLSSSPAGPETNGLYAIDATANYTDPLVAGWESQAPLGRTYIIQYPLHESHHFNCSSWFIDKADAAGLCTPNSTREIRVYIPASYRNGQEAALLFGGDDSMGHSPGRDGCLGCYNKRPAGGQPGFSMLRVMLDRLIGAPGKRSMPMTILINTNNADGRDTEMQTMDGRYAEFLQQEVLEKVKADPNIRKDGYTDLKFTQNPKGRALLGCSSGGAQAMIAAYFRPDIIGIALAFSATIVSEPSTAKIATHQEYPLGAAEFWAGQRLLATQAKKDIRVFHSVGEHDLGTHSGPYSTEPWASGAGWLAAGEKGQSIPAGEWPGQTNGCVMGTSVSPMCNTTDNTTDPHTGARGTCNPFDNWALANNISARDLQSKGYAHRFAYVQSACHCDPRVYFQDLPNILAWGFKEYRAAQ